jgi:hypothetical protein
MAETGEPVGCADAVDRPTMSSWLALAVGRAAAGAAATPHANTITVTAALVLTTDLRDRYETAN